MNRGTWILLGLTALAAACSSESSSEPGTSTGTSTATATGTGTGSGTTSTNLTIASVGKVSDECAPNDGPAVMVSIGAQPMCTEQPPGGAPQADYLAFPGSTAELTAGQSWSYDAASVGQELSVQWYPAGPSGTAQAPVSASLEVLSVGTGTPATASVHYELVTEAGATYSGDATVAICPTTPTCG